MRNSLTQPNSAVTRAAIMGALVLLSIAMVYMPIARVLSLSSTYYDLGVFQNISFRLEQNLTSAEVFSSGHISWFLPVYSYLSLFLPSDYRWLVLLVLQSICLFFPVLVLARMFGYLCSIAYALYAPVWANILFDFHSDHLVVPLLLWFYIAFIRGNVVASVVSALALCFVKEVYALQTVMCGLMLCMASISERVHEGLYYRNKLTADAFYGGLILIFFGATYFLVATHYLIPYYSYLGNSGFTGGDSFGWLGDTLYEMLKFLVSRPQDVLYEVISDNNKLKYVALVFGLLGFIPLFGLFYAIPAIPLVLISILSETPGHSTINSHYTAGLIIPLIIAFNYGFLKFRVLLASHIVPLCSRHSLNAKWFAFRGVFSLRTLLLSQLVLFNILFSLSPLSRLFWTEKVWGFGMGSYQVTERTRLISEAIVALVPSNELVIVSTQNSLNSPHLARRQTYLSFPQGVLEPINVFSTRPTSFNGFVQFAINGITPAHTPEMRYADYLIIDMKRPLYLLDKGCEWVDHQCRNDKAVADFHAALSQARLKFQTIFAYDGFEILKRMD